jgi:trehalose 6-phosphate synthase/phosphatase
MRLVIVSNRLPITAVEHDGAFHFKESIGGLTSGLSTYLNSLGDSSPVPEYLWIGWPGATVTDEGTKEALRTEALSSFHAYPVFLTEAEMNSFYHGFCNKTIWALFHYFTSYTVYHKDYWTEYQRVNRIFADAVEKIVRPDDVIWVHDYHLMLLPRLLRSRFPDSHIGFFLHIPFPAFEVFRLLPGPWRNEILEGILGADLVGFHTQDYAQYFLRCVLRLLGRDHNMGTIQVDHKLVKVDTFPMGIDFQKFNSGSQNTRAQQEIHDFKQSVPDSHIILSIDRQDYTKGIPNRLLGYERFLEKNPQFHGKVLLVIVVVPSRIGVDHYRVLKKQTDELVGRIIGRFARVDWNPILYMYKGLAFDPLVELYGVSDVMLVTPLRDGMNLIAKEFIAAKKDETGVLILSEMAGASRELGEAIQINPNNVEEIADALRQALEMPAEEQVLRNRPMQQRLRRYDVRRWADDFINSLIECRDRQKRLEATLLTPDTQQRMLADFRKSWTRLFLLDYDGTLAPFASRPELAAPGKEVVDTLDLLASCPATTVVILSGRDRLTLEKWLSHLPISIVAEHGAWVRHPTVDWTLVKQLSADWIAQLMAIFELYVDRLPGSFIEQKEFSIVFHYRKADSELASLRVRELTDNLVQLTANMDVQVLQGSKVVEIRNAGINKGNAARLFLEQEPAPDFTLAAGDDWTDEDLFRVLPATSYSFKVGLSPSHARFNMRDPAEVLRLLRTLAGSVL